MIRLAKGKSSVTRWDAPGTYFGTTGGTGSNQIVLNHNQNREVSKCVVRHAGTNQCLFSSFDRTSQISRYHGHIGYIVNDNRYDVYLYITNFFNANAEVEISLYFFEE